MTPPEYNALPKDHLAYLRSMTFAERKASDNAGVLTLAHRMAVVFEAANLQGWDRCYWKTQSAHLFHIAEAVVQTQAKNVGMWYSRRDDAIGDFMLLGMPGETYRGEEATIGTFTLYGFMGDLRNIRLCDVWEDYRYNPRTGGGVIVPHIDHTVALDITRERVLLETEPPIQPKRRKRAMRSASVPGVQK